MNDQQRLSSLMPNPQSYDWKDVFDGGSRGTEARAYFLALPEIQRFKSDPVMRFMFSGQTKSLTVGGKLIGLFLKILAALSFDKFAPFHLRDGKIEFPSAVVSLKRFMTTLLYRVRGAPGYFVGGLILNILGLQVFRTMYYHLRSKARIRAMNAGKVETSMEKAVREHGYVVVEDVLAPTTVAGLNRMLDDKTLVMPYKREHHPCGWTKYIIHSGGEGFTTASSESTHPYAREVLRDTRIFQAIERLSGRKMDVTPEIAIFEWKVTGDKVNTAHQFDFEELLHADVSYPSFKIFLYLNDVTVANGPFVYCPDTHKLTLKRLAMEYVLSIAYYLTNKQPPEPPQPHRITNWFIHKLGMRVLPITGRANSMVLANVMGFHGRRNFESTTPRRALFLNFRYLDAKVLY